MKSTDIIIVHQGSEDKIEVLKAFLKALKIKFEVAKDKLYNAEFIAKIERSRQDIKKGKGRTITLKELDSLWK